MKRSRHIDHEEEKEVIPESFTGVARTIECYQNNGIFKNFRIVTLCIENGIVIKKIYSDPYCSFEALAFLEIWNDHGMIKLNGQAWGHGKTMGLVDYKGTLR